MARFLAEVRLRSDMQWDRPRKTAFLLDGLVAKFDLAGHQFGSTGHDMIELPPSSAAILFPRFLDLPTEIRSFIFSLSLQPYVIQLYSEERHRVATVQQRVHKRTDLPPISTDAQTPTRVIFVGYRPAHTIPLLHACRASREWAISRYGVPSPDELLFNPAVDSVRLFGRWPYAADPTPRRIFEADELPMSLFSRSESLQLQIFGFSTGTSLSAAPDILNNQDWPQGFELVSPGASSSISNPAADLCLALSWVETRMPQLKQLILIISLEDLEEESRVLAGLVNIRTSLVMVEEWKLRNKKPPCMPHLHSLALEMVPGGTIVSEEKQKKEMISDGF